MFQRIELARLNAHGFFQRSVKPGSPLSLASRRAFTLVEVMLVVIILSILAGATISNVRTGYESVMLDDNATLLEEISLFVQDYAKDHHCFCRMEFDTDANECYISSAPPCSAFEQLQFTPLKGELSSAIRLSEGVFIKDVVNLSKDLSGKNEVFWGPDGAPQPAQIFLGSRLGSERIVTIGSI